MHIIEGKQHYNLNIKLRLYVKRYMIYNGTKNVAKSSKFRLLQFDL